MIQGINASLILHPDVPQMLDIHRNHRAQEQTTMTFEASIMSVHVS